MSEPASHALPMPRNDAEVFTHLIGYDGAAYEINLLTYAIFADERAKWVDHYRVQNGNPPDLVATELWISNITEQHFEHMRMKAARGFDAAARLYLKDEIQSLHDGFEQEKKQLLDSEIINRVKAAGSFPKQLSIALLTAIIAPIMIGGIIAAFLAYNEVFPTFIQVPSGAVSAKEG